MPVHLVCTALECGRGMKYPEKTHTDIMRMCKLHTDSGPGWKLILFYHQGFFKKTLNETRLFEDLLYYLVVKHNWSFMKRNIFPASPYELSLNVNLILYSLLLKSKQQIWYFFKWLFGLCKYRGRGRNGDLVSEEGKGYTQGNSLQNCCL